MSPQMLILHQSSPDIYHFLAEYYNFKKNIGPAADSMYVSISFQIIITRFSIMLVESALKFA
jgi:hypothetical protein